MRDECFETLMVDRRQRGPWEGRSEIEGRGRRGWSGHGERRGRNVKNGREGFWHMGLITRIQLLDIDSVDGLHIFQV